MFDLPAGIFLTIKIHNCFKNLINTSLKAWWEFLNIKKIYKVSPVTAASVFFYVLFFLFVC